MLAVIDDTAFDIVKLLHLIGAIGGFGGVLLNPLYANRVKAARDEGPALAIFDANAAATKIAEYLIYSLPLTGIALLFMSGEGPDGKKNLWFDQVWVSASFLLYIVAIALVLGVMNPTQIKMRGALASGGGPELEALGKRAGAVGGVLHLLFTIVLVLMVFKPGL